MSVQSPTFEKVESKRSRAATRVEEIVGVGFDVKNFVENFEVLVNVAGSTKHLKELVLQLAVRGRLSSPSKETADSLLLELKGARTRLAKTGVRIGEPSVAVMDEECPYLLPAGWRWVRLRDLGGFLGGGTPAKANASFWEGPLPWVSPKDMKRPYIDDAEDHISMAAVQGSAVKLIPKQSLLCVVRGMILAHSFPVAIATREVTINQDMKALVLAMPELAEFVLRSCQAARTRVLAQVERSTHGTCRLDSEAVETLPLALPPLAEQKRIVARVDELMRLLDDLEAKRTGKRETQVRFRAAALGALTSAEGLDAVATSWTRVARNFEVVFEHAASVADLRDVVLDLATRGVLVPRMPAEGSGQALLAKIVSRRNALKPGSTTDGTVASADPVVPHAIPPEWTWVSLEAATHPVRLVRYGMLMPGPDRPTGPLYVKVRNMKKGIIDVASLPRTTPEIYAKFAGAALAKGDLLMSIRGSFGGVALVPHEIDGANITQDSARIAPMEGVDRRYLLYVLRSPLSQRYFAAVAKGAAVQGLNIGDIRRTAIPLPPLAEQKRLVAKVEALMGLCDELEAKLRRAEDRAAKLVEAVVQELVA